jgi:lysophospholipase L1-like esterase
LVFLNPILFVGSSSIEKWPALQAAFPGGPVLNRGVSSFKLEDLLHFFDRLILPYRPALVVLYGGDNDLDAGLSVNATLALYQEFLSRVDRVFPGTPVVLLAVKASPKRIQQLALQMELNRRLVDLARSRPRTEWVDTFTPLLDTAGRPDTKWFLDDHLHLNTEGYALWNQSLRPVLARCLENPAPAKP